MPAWLRSPYARRSGPEDHYYLNAAQDWAGQQVARVGQGLISAAVHLGSALAWANQKLDEATMTALANARDIGQKLAEGSEVAADEVGQALEDVGQGIRRLGTDKRK